MKVPLTELQREMLEPYFAAVREADKQDNIAAIVAQVWTDGFVVKVLNGYEAKALAKALGGNIDSRHYSAEGRVSD